MEVKHKHKDGCLLKNKYNNIASFLSLSDFILKNIMMEAEK